MGAQDESFVAAAAEDGHQQAFATGAAGGGLAGLRLFSIDRSLVVKTAGFLSIELEGAPAVGANVVVAALGLAGIDDVAAAALLAANDLLEREQRHIEDSSNWQLAFGI